MTRCSPFVAETLIITSELGSVNLENREAYDGRRLLKALLIIWRNQKIGKNMIHHLCNEGEEVIERKFFIHCYLLYKQIEYFCIHVFLIDNNYILIFDNKCL